jgi:hypothetical protein
MLPVNSLPELIAEALLTWPRNCFAIDPVPI